MRLSRELLLIYIAAFVRSFGVGLLGVVLGVYLFRVGLNSTRIGFVLAAGLAGGTLATTIVGLRGDYLGRRRVLAALAVFSCAGAIGLAIVPSFGLLLALAFVGMLNGMGTDRSATHALELAIIPGFVPDRNRTWALSWYNVLLDGGSALGALAAGIPLAVHSRTSLNLVLAYRYTFFAYAPLQLLTSALYLGLSPNIEVAGGAHKELATLAVSQQAKRVVHRLAALFSLDSFGGGFLGDALVAYWFFRRFGVDEQQLAVLFFTVNLLNAMSHLGAAWLARRIGLVNTMVFTHLPSSLFLIGAAFAPSATIAIVLFLLREALVEMDVPTRQSYVAALVKPHERTYASGITNLTRTIGWAGASSVAGAMMQNVAFSGPLILGGGCKIVYDLLLYSCFSHLKAPEERHAVSTQRNLSAKANPHS